MALVDTNSDPDDADYPIAANDDAIRSVRLLLGAVSQAITQARAEFESKKSRRVNEEAARRRSRSRPKRAAPPSPLQFDELIWRTEIIIFRSVHQLSTIQLINYG